MIPPLASRCGASGSASHSATGLRAGRGLYGPAWAGGGKGLVSVDCCVARLALSTSAAVMPAVMRAIARAGAKRRKIAGVCAP